MARMRLAVVVGVALLAACQELPHAATKRAELRKLAGDRLEILPSEGQLPYCLVFTRSQSGVLRQLTMTHENRSVRCMPGEPVGRVSYRIPVEEGEVSLFVFFSDQKLHAGSVSQQLYELPPDQRFTPINLRLPGRVFVETLAFKPVKDDEVATGAVVLPDGKLQEAPPGDGGAAGKGAVTSDGTR